jgi:hypothetical protein
MISFVGSSPFVDPFMCGIRAYGGKHRKKVFPTIFCYFYSQMIGYGGPKGTYMGS